MTFSEQLRIIVRLHQLIKRKGTGTPERLAFRLNLSRASTFRYINEMKSLGAPIQYCRFKQTYYYERQFELDVLMHSAN